eukprot:7108742-Alexandrium_andersonii.AAC.1
MCIRDRGFPAGSAPRTPLKSASGAPAGLFCRQIRQLRQTKQHSMRPTRASGNDFEAVFRARAVP